METSFLKLMYIFNERLSSTLSLDSANSKFGLLGDPGNDTEMQLSVRMPLTKRVIK